MDKKEKDSMPGWARELRNQFPVTGKWAYFDSAYECSGAAFQEEASRKYFRDKSDFYPGIPQEGGSGKGAAIGVVEETRDLLSDLIHGEGGRNIAFTQNTCQAVGLFAESFPFESGDNVVIGDIEHVSVLYPIISLRKRGVEVRLVHAENEWSLTAEKLLEHVDEHTRFVAVSFVQSASGYRIDMKKLADGCHKMGCLVLTDAIQILGFQDVDVKKLGIDALAASFYKGILSIEGGGFLYVSTPVLKELSPNMAGPNPALRIDRESGTYQIINPADARKLEAGTLPFHTLYCTNASLRLILSIGMDEISKHIEECWQAVLSGLTAIGYRIDTPAAHHCHSMLVCTKDKDGMAAYFQSHGVFITAGHGDHVRISVNAFTSPEDIGKLIETAENWYSEK